MKSAWKLLLLMSLFSWDTFSVQAQKSNQTRNDFNILMTKIRNDFQTNPEDSIIKTSLDRFDLKKGAFKDIDYTRTDRTKWPPAIHIDRLFHWAQAYTNPKNQYYKNNKIYESIVSGLQYWYDVNPECSNWWFNQIYEPQKLGLILIQMRKGEKQVPTELEKKTTDRILKDGGHPSKWTGANRTDIALHWIYRACLTESEADLKIALDNAFSPVKYTTEEGFQYDNSYFQHGSQLYIGGYGDEVLKGITQVANYVQGTQYALSKDKIALLSKFMRETYYQTIRGKYMLFDVLGRGISRPNILDKSSMALFAKRMLKLDPVHKKEFQTIIDRMEGRKPANYGWKPKHTHYFRADYTLHVRPKYTFDVRMASVRAEKCEYGNRENLKTYFLSDGCTCMVVHGDEYYNIPPVWNWSRLPGITSPQMDTIPMDPRGWGDPTNTTFAGGVSDSLYGATGYSYFDHQPKVQTGANKSWFFFDDEVVCLGNVSSASAYAIKTTVNQTLVKHEKVLLGIEDSNLSLDKGEHNFSSPKWVLHNQIAYLFPQGGNVWVNYENQSGNWYDINHSYSKKQKEKEVFSLGFNYGKQPQNASYCYLVLPGVKTLAEVEEYYRKSPVEIVCNEKMLQSVYHKNLKIWQIIFFEGGSLTYKGLTVTADKDCALMLKENQEGYTIHIADPAQKQEQIQITLEQKTSDTEVWKQVVNADFTKTGIYAGATRKYIVKK